MSTPSIAVITTVHNEKDLLPQFLRHYAPQVDRILILDNGSTDGCLDATAGHPNVTLSRYDSSGLLDDVLRHLAIIDTKATCVGRYDYVILADCDEFVHPKENGKGIRQVLIETGLKDIYGTDGYCMFEVGGDAPYDPARPLVEQRKWGIPVKSYCKPIVMRANLHVHFGLGFHQIDSPFAFPVSSLGLDNAKNSPFYMLHYLGVTKEMFIRRRQDRQRSERSIRMNTSNHLADRFTTRGFLEAQWNGEFMRSPTLAKLPI